MPVGQKQSDTAAIALPSRAMHDEKRGPGTAPSAIGLLVADATAWSGCRSV